MDKTADYGVGCDWWSLGIIAYELLYESTPFEDDSTSKTYANIMNYKVSWKLIYRTFIVYYHSFAFSQLILV